MDPSKYPNPEHPKQIKAISPWLAFPLALIVWWAIPWVISLLAPHFGWVTGRPGPWNYLGLIPVLVGTIGLIWGVAAHSAQASGKIEMELDKSYLLNSGMYAISRHPMYLSELILLSGWIIFYGSVAVLVVFVIWFFFFNFFAIPQEERVLEHHFGEAYREYKQKVRRWL